MNSLLQLLRTTTFRLTVVFVVIFVIFAVAVLGYAAYQASIQVQQQQIAAIERELNVLAAQYRRRGTAGLIQAIQRFAQGPGPGIYYVTDPNGFPIAGNVLDVPPEVLQYPGQHTFAYERDRPVAEGETADSTRGVAFVRSFVLPSGVRLVVGRDIVERRSFGGIIVQAFFWGVAMIVVFGVIAGAMSARRVLSRIDSITGTSEAIMSGNLSERVPVTQRNDEFDRLATSLNAMLDRIEHLMAGLKDVTDNIAHDLKTPLTRLRNRLEAAMRDGENPGTSSEALEAAIVESERLIATFNALLLIARVEAGSTAGLFEPVDVADIVTDVAELYQPVAEDAGLALKVEAASHMKVRASRELISQALVNLVENAIKYAPPSQSSEPVVEIRVIEQGTDVVLEVADHGPGIPAEDRERVLERFVRLDEARVEAGSGLGLSLVAAVARLHNGRVEIEDNRPGARLRLVLPVHAAS